MSRNTFNRREGIILQLKKGGITTYGEAAPLPGFSRESLDEVKDQLMKHAAEIAGLFSKKVIPARLEDFYENNNILPSLCFALDTLAYTYLAQTKGLTTGNLLFDDPRTSVPVNAVVTIQAVPETLQAVSGGVDEGYRTFKFKIGRNFEEELNTLTCIRDRFPDIVIRVDANRAWHFDEALSNLGKLEKLTVEYCEEPLRNPAPGTLEKLSVSSGIPLALDETLTDSNAIQSVIPFIPVLVLKPMVIGRFSDFFEIKRLAEVHGNKIVFTTALEGGIGRMMTAILASGLGSRQSAHGLATGHFLAVDVWQDGTYINRGNFSLPDDLRPDGIHQTDLQNLAKEIYFPSGR